MTLHRKLLREKYKTREGARNRAIFEDAIARDKVQMYRHFTVLYEGLWRVERRDAVALARIRAAELARSA